MISLNIDEIEQNLSGFIKLIQEGNRLIITQADRPIAEIQPISTNPPQKEPRPSNQDNEVYLSVSSGLFHLK